MNKNRTIDVEVSMSTRLAHITITENHTITGVAPRDVPAGEYDVTIPKNGSSAQQIDIASALKASSWGNSPQHYDRKQIYSDHEEKWDRLYGR